LECEKLTDCVRCGKEAGTFEIGMVSRYGAVCSSCVRYFREEIECPECGAFDVIEGVCFDCGYELEEGRDYEREKELERLMEKND
ncbi:MAG: hypothetical protein HXM26_01650, partial [Haemophilus parainfluenzae]|nr:hypothetical protein [Haemophilus parainfluenzae]